MQAKIFCLKRKVTTLRRKKILKTLNLLNYNSKQLKLTYFQIFKIPCLSKSNNNNIDVRLLLCHRFQNFMGLVVTPTQVSMDYVLIIET